MSEHHYFEKESNLSIGDLSKISERLKHIQPVLYDILIDTVNSDPELYERATIGLIKYLRENEGPKCGGETREIAKVQRDVINLLAGRISDKN